MKLFSTFHVVVMTSLRSLLARQLSYLMLVFFCLLLSACAPVSVGDDSAYVIKSTPAISASKRKNNAVILVLQPNTVPMYDTRSMAYSNAPFKVSYYAKNRWAETPSNMLSPLLTKTLQKTHHFKAVVNSPYSGSYHYLLSTEITELLQDYNDCNSPVLKFGLRAQLSNGAGRIISVKEFSSTVPMRAKNPYAGVLAANEAVEEVLGQLAKWVK